MSDSKSAKSYIQCWGNRVYFSRPIVRVLIRQACWGKPSILFTLALPRVGFPIWGFPPPGFRVANFAWHYPLSKPNLLGCSKLKPYLSMLKRVSKNRRKDSCLVTVAPSLFSPPFLQVQLTPAVCASSTSNLQFYHIAFKDRSCHNIKANLLCWQAQMCT